MNQVTAEGVDEEVAGGGAGDNDAVVTENEPFKGGNGLVVDGREVGSDLEGRGGGGMRGPREEEDGEAICEEKGMGVNGAEEIRVLNEPMRFSCSKLAQFIARNASQFRLVRSPRHCLCDLITTHHNGNEMWLYLRCHFNVRLKLFSIL